MSNRPSAISGTRLLRYRIDRINSYWWCLTANIPVEYHFALEPLWSDTRKRAFRAGFEEQGARAWTRQHLLESDGMFSTIRTEVRVVIGRRRAAQNEQWHVVAVPPEATNAQSHVEYAYTGHFPRGLEPPEGPVYERVAVVQLKEADLGCNWRHLREDQPRLRRTLQIGAAHEVGHMLGMQHPVCVGNESLCYGDPRERSGASIMGLGSWVAAEDYRWAQRIMERETTSRWSVVNERRGPAAPMCQSPSR